MKFSIISFTQNGMLLSKKIARTSDAAESVLYTKCSACSAHEHQVQLVTQEIGAWAKEQLEEGNALLFIGACGIAVRAIAPYITDKLHDSPVLVTDEKGRYVIPILSGHMGGANELAVSLAEQIGAEPILTTATDLNDQFAVDLFAKKNVLAIVNRDGIARVSSKVLSGKSITMSVQQGHLEKACKLPKGIELTEYPPSQRVDVVITAEDQKFEAALLLIPKEYVVGIGCKRGKEASQIEAFMMRHLQKAGISLMQVAGLASIDVKKDEPGLLAWSRKERIPFMTYTAAELRSVEGVFHESEFVREQVGVDNVCERAALRLCGPEGRLIYAKHAEDGMTLAVARREWRVSFDEE